MPRLKTGILGVKKDPKNQMLFSFRNKGGADWPSSDSDDSDYEPSPDETEKVGLCIQSQRKKRQGTKGDLKNRKTANQKKKSQTRKKSVNDNSKCTTDISDLSLEDIDNKNNTKKVKSVSKRQKMLTKQDSGVDNGFENDAWGQLIPPEVLLRIFQCVVEQEGALPFLCKAAKVCSLWNEIATHSSLWGHVDLSYGWIKDTDKTLQWLCKNRLKNVKVLSLQTWKSLNIDGVTAIAEHCKQLESIDVSNCRHFNALCLKKLVDECQQITTIDLSRVSTDAVSRSSLTYFITKCGSNLKSFIISGNVLKGFQTILNTVADNCPELEVLEVCNAHFSSDFISLNIEKLQCGCPKMKALRLTNSKFRSSYAAPSARGLSSGFPALEDLSVAISAEGMNIGIGMDDGFLIRLLKSSKKLKLLDIRGSSHITNEGIQSLPITDLERLFVGQSSIARYDGIEVIMQKWQHSLVELDLSWNIYPGMSLDLAMHKLSDDPSKSKLEILSLCGTQISCTRLESILQGCPNLKSLNLTSCRGLPRGMKRFYKGTELDTMRDNIDKIIAEANIENTVS